MSRLREIRAKGKKGFAVGLLFLSGFALSFCSGVAPERAEWEGEDPPLWMESLNQDMQRGFQRFRVGPGDVLETIYQFIPQAEENTYRFAVRDVLEVEFFYHNQLNRILTVRPDGCITLPLIGDVKALNLTPEDFRQRIMKKYEGVLRQPEITVTVKDFGVRLEELRNSLVSASRGQSRLVKVGPDGWMELPLIGGIYASGKTPEDLQEELNSRYKAVHHDISISLSLSELNSYQVFILGEVRSPGNYPLKRASTVLEAVAMAGGSLSTACLDSVVVISRDSRGVPEGRIVDVSSMMEGKVSAVDPFVKSLDVIYVPQTTIAKVNDFIQQYIRGMLLFNGFHIPMVYDLHREFNDSYRDLN